MADYDGILLISEEDLIGAFIPYASSLLFAQDAGYFAAVGGAPYVTPQIVTPLDLPSDMPSLLLHNWIAGCAIKTTYMVDITSSITDAEERRLLAPKPVRSIQVRWTGLDKNLSYKILTSILRLGMHRMPIPLYSDFSTVNVGAMLRTVYCETINRRFFKGARCVLFDMIDGEPANIEYALIDNVQLSHLVLQADLTNTYSQGAIVMPLIDAEVSLQSVGHFKTNTVSEFLLQAQEVIGPSAGLPTASGIPPGVQVHEDTPIFAPTPHLPNTGYSIGYARAGKLGKLGRGKTSDTYGSRPKITHKLMYRKATRSQAWPIIQFFDSRRGDFRRFWLVPPEDYWTASAIGTTYVSILAVGNFNDLGTFFSHIAIIMKSGLIHIRTIDNTIDNSSTWRMDFDTEIVGLVGVDVDRVVPAHKLRFSKSVLLEKWHTDQTCDITLDFLEVLDEDSVTLLCLT